MPLAWLRFLPILNRSPVQWHYVCVEGVCKLQSVAGCADILKCSSSKWSLFHSIQLLRNWKKNYANILYWVCCSSFLFFSWLDKLQTVKTCLYFCARTSHIGWNLQAGKNSQMNNNNNKKTIALRAYCLMYEATKTIPQACDQENATDLLHSPIKEIFHCSARNSPAAAEASDAAVSALSWVPVLFAEGGIALSRTVVS